ncbi:translocase of chloroplast 159, chloroplastic-like [Vicia villosa]|uniref:translocase of chloroplast 159, chloroplastic-like n=1 Tax=Vicia villosa TaxID=3911 RepID=UPI00273B6737|nr:translocase of chloroplast 159, chloroplastic-like [Vicia villosa]
MDSQTLSSSSQFHEPNNLLNGVNGHGSDSDDGFVSGEDEAEPSTPILVYDAKSTVREKEEESFDQESPRPIAKVTADDEDEAEEEEEDSLGVVGLEKGGGEKDVEEEVKEDEVFVEADDKGFESVDSEGGEVVGEGINNGLQEKGDGGTGIEAVRSDSVVVESVSGDNSGVGVVENGDGVVDDDEKFASGGDVVVDSLQVNPLVDGGVAVVGDGVKDEVVAPAPVVSLDNSFEAIEKVGSESVVDEVGSKGDEVAVVDEVVGGDVESRKVVDSGVEIGVDDSVAHEQVSDIVNEKAGDVFVDENVGGDAKPDEVVDIGVDDGVAHRQVSDIPSSEKGGEISEVVTRSLEPAEDEINIESRAVAGEDGSNVVEVEGGSHAGNVVVKEEESNVVEVEDESHVGNVVEKEEESNVVEVEDESHVGNVVEKEEESNVVEVEGGSHVGNVVEKEEESNVVEVEGGSHVDNVVEKEEESIVVEVEGGSHVDHVVEKEEESNVVEVENERRVGNAVEGETESNVDRVAEVEDETHLDNAAVGESKSNFDRVVEVEDETHFDNAAKGEAESNVDRVVEVEDNTHFDNVAKGEAESNVDRVVEVEDDTHFATAVEEEADSNVDRVIEVDDSSNVEAAVDHHIDREIDDSVSDTKDESMIFGGSDSANKYLEELEKQIRASESSQDDRIDGQIVSDSDEEVVSDDEGDSKELFDSATLAALLKAASEAGGEDGGGITLTAQDGSRLFSVERPAGLGPSLQTGKPAVRSIRPNLFASSMSRAGNVVSESDLSEEDKKKLEKLQEIRIKFLRMIQRLGFTTEESIAAQVLYRLTLVAGRQAGEIFSLDAAKESASRLEAEERDNFAFSLNILVLGKTGVGKSATINSIFGETKTSFSAYGPATTSVTEIVGMVDGVKIRVFDTPGLKSSAFEQSYNRKVLSTVKKLTKNSPPDIVLYVDRLDLQTRDMNDLPMLRSVTSALGPAIWRNVIVTLTHAASAPPDGPSGSPLSYDVFVAQRSHIVQQTIGQAVGDLRLMNPNLMNPVSLVENHPSCRKNRDGQKVLPNGQSWRPLLLLLCYSMKILSEATNTSKAQEAADNRRLFGFRSRAPPLPYLLSWLLQSRAHPKLPDQGGIDNGDSDIEMVDLSDSDGEEGEDEYDQLPPFKPLKKSQFAKLNGEQKKAYLEEYDYRVKLLQKKQWREELKRMRDMKKRGGQNFENDNGYMEEDEENGSPAAVQVPLPDMVLPQSFDSDSPAYRYRFLEPNSQLLTRPVLDTHSWDHDCGYDGVNIENSMAIINKFPAAVTVQVTKDKQDFSIHLDSSVAAKHGENGSTMAGFDIQNIGKQLAYIVRGETKFKNFKRNKTAAGVSVTFLGENVSTGVKLEDQIALGKRLVLVGSTGTVRSQNDSAYGANVEVRLREADFPVGQDQSSLSLSLVQWRGDLALGANFQSQISLGRSYKMAVRAGLNNKLSGQITVRTSSSDQLQIALIAILPVARAIYKNFWPGVTESYSLY